MPGNYLLVLGFRRNNEDFVLVMEPVQSSTVPQAGHLSASIHQSVIWVVPYKNAVF